MLLLYIFFMGSFNYVLSQSEIIENEWQLKKLIYNGIEYTIPEDEEINSILLNIIEDPETDNIYHFTTSGVCGSGVGGMMSYITDESFSFFDIAGNFPSNCENSENQNFADLYLAFYVLNFEDDFPYFIAENDDGSKTLVVYNVENNQAVYSNLQMSVQDNDNLKLNFYPNPVKDKLTIENTGLKITSVTVKDVSGKIVAKQVISAKQAEVDFSHLPKGIYFVSFEQNSKILQTEKVVKR